MHMCTCGCERAWMCERVNMRECARVRVCVCGSEAHAGSRSCGQGVWSLPSAGGGPGGRWAVLAQPRCGGESRPRAPFALGRPTTQSGHRAPAVPPESPSWHPGAGPRRKRGHVTRQASGLRGGPAGPDAMCRPRQGPLAALCKLETGCLSWKMGEPGVCHAEATPRGGRSGVRGARGLGT